MKKLLFFAMLCAAPLHAAPVEIVREIKPLSIRGVNYYPALTPWGGMWTKTPEAVWEKDMALCASLNINTVRTFLMTNEFVDAQGNVAPEYLQKFETFLSIAWKNGIRVVPCFEFVPRDKKIEEAAWKRAMSAFVTAHKNDGRILMWDLMNEPESRDWDAASREYLKAALPFIKQLDGNHLSTVGIAYQIGKLAEIGLPDVLQYHEYAPKKELFEQGSARVEKTIETMRRFGGVRPVFIGEFGMSTARDAQFGAGPQWMEKLPPPPGNEAEQTLIYGLVFNAAEKAKIAGVMAWCLHSYPTQEKGFLTPTESMFGLMRHDGTLKPAALLLRDTFRRWRETK
jgi:endo-1,4-beta-mannosidase